MFTGLYRAATAMDYAERMHEVASTNIAFAHLPGYRRGALGQRFESVSSGAADIPDEGSLIGEMNNTFERTDLREGTYRSTGSPLDLAIRGNGYFVVEADSGPLYTRNGSFRIGSSGEVTTVDGLKVRGRGGTLVVPVGHSAREIMVSGDGRLLLGNQEIGQLDIVGIDPHAPVERAGASLLSVQEDYVRQADGATIVQGVIESSNVQPVEELVNILIGSRQYEAAQRIVRSLSDVSQANNQLK